MANPFDQFDTLPAEGITSTEGVPQPPTIQPGQTPEAALDAVAPQGENLDPKNPFNNLEAADAPMGDDDFARTFYAKLNAGEKPETILQWSKDVGREIIPDENFYENIRIRDAALRDNKKGTYGRINSLKEGETAPLDVLGAGGAFLRQGGNTALFNFGDELESAARAGVAALSGEDFGEAYRRRHDQLQSANELDWTVHPVASGLGVAAGALGGAAATPSIMGAKAVQNAGLAARAGAGAAEGAVMGGIAATGEGTPDDRLAATGPGAVIGGLVGGSVSPALAAIGRIGRPIIERLRPDEAKALASRLGYSPEQVQAAEAELARQRGLGIQDATLLDVIDEPGRNVIGTAGTRDAARAELQDFAASRQTQLPERMQQVADEMVAPPNRVPGTTDEIRTGIEAQRDAEITAAMDADIGGGLTLRTAPVPMTEDIADVLGTTMGQRAIRNVINTTTDAGERQAFEQLLSTARQRARSVDPRLSEAAQQAAQGAAIESMPFTIGMSERIGRELNRMGQEQGNSALFSFGRTVRDAANASPRFREIMQRYGDLSEFSNAVGVGSGVANVMDEAGNVSRVANEGSGFLAEPAARFEQRVGDLGTAPMTDAEGGALRVGGTRIENIPAPRGTIEITPVDTGYGSDRSFRGTYDGPNGEEVPFSLTIDGTTAHIDINEFGDSADPNEIGPAIIRDAQRAIQQRFPELTRFEGVRISGAGAGRVQSIPSERPRTVGGTPAPSQRDLARIGAAEQVAARAGRGPSEAASTARQLYDSPEQHRRAVALLGENGARRLAERSKAEVERVYRATRQASKEGPANEQGLAAVESGVNALYNPGPISALREGARFLHRIGLSERDALWIVRNAIDPSQTQAIINRLKKAGADEMRARAYAEQLRASAVRYFTSNEES